MGFDLHGRNPENAGKRPTWDKDYPVGGKNEDSELKKEFDIYIQALNKWEDNNPGDYFRNNVWFWRPLWSYVADNCDDILTENDIERGSYNDGHIICKTKAKAIAKRLRKLIKDGHTDAYAAWYEESRSNMDDKDWDKSYPFNTQNVVAFERFCEKSGGFDIC